MILFDKHRRARKNLSAYADGELPAKKATRLEAHLETCEECRLELDEVRATIGALRSLPEVTPRRSFTLTPQMVGAPVPARSGGPSPTLVQGLRLTAAGLAAALVLVFVIDVADSGTSDNDISLTGAFTAGDALERATDGANPEAADGENDFSAVGDDDEISATADPKPMYDSATPPPDSPTGYPAYGGISSDVDGGDGGSSSGGVAEPVSDGAEDDSAGDPPAADDRDATQDPYAGDSGTETSSDEEPEKSVSDTDADTNTDNGGNDAADGEAASLSSDDGGFDTLLALEIGLGAALAVALAGAIWLTLAARRREVRH